MKRAELGARRTGTMRDHDDAVGLGLARLRGALVRVVVARTLLGAPLPHQSRTERRPIARVRIESRTAVSGAGNTVR